jgi:hypothetical protein
VARELAYEAARGSAAIYEIIADFQDMLEQESPGVMRGMLVCSVAPTLSAQHDIDILVLARESWSQRRRIPARGTTLDVFLESNASLARSVKYAERDIIVRMLASGEIIADDDGTLARYQESARAIVERPRPLFGTTLLFTHLAEPLDLLRAYEAASSDGENRSLLLGQLISVTLRSKLRLSGGWDVPTKDLLRAAGEIDPELASAARAILRTPFRSARSDPRVRDFVARALGAYGHPQTLVTPRSYESRVQER